MEEGGPVRPVDEQIDINERTPRKNNLRDDNVMTSNLKGYLVRMGRGKWFAVMGLDPRQGCC